MVYHLQNKASITICSQLHCIQASINPALRNQLALSRVLLRGMSASACTNVFSLPSHHVVNPSLWIKLAPKREHVFPQLDASSELECDVCVIGGGITGVSAASELKERGLRVVLLESRDIGGSTTGFSTAKLSLQHGLNYHGLASSLGKEAAAKYVELNLHGRSEIKRRIETYKLACEFEERAHVLFTSDDKQMSTLREEYEAAKAAGMPNIDFIDAASSSASSSGGDTSKASFIAELATHLPIKALSLQTGKRSSTRTPMLQSWPKR